MSRDGLCNVWLNTMVVVALFHGYITRCYADSEPQYQTATIPILSEVIKELSAAKMSMESTRDQLVNAEYSVKKLVQTALDQKSRRIPQVFSGHKLVHLDLTGAPPKMSYLLELIPFSRTWGATGFLVDYASNFPFEGDLQVIADPTTYSKEEITSFQRECANNNLVVIPMIQTFGHLEFVLKHEEFANLRETERYTNSLCPCHKGSLILVKKMIDQTLALHPNSQWLHVGGDEVWNLKTCEKCKFSNASEEELFLKHMVPVLMYVRQRGKTAVMWDDMLRKWSLQQLQSLSQLVEPMLWGYRSPLLDILPQEVWLKYGATFPRVWMASAFKGAYRSNADFVRINLRLQNNLDFVKALSMLPNTTTVMGIALTGWSRYDHFGTLCELLPASIPSLVICLTAVNQGYLDNTLLAQISRSLGFQNTIDVNKEYAKHFSDCNANFPGHEAYEMICKLSMAHHKLELATDTKKSWTLPRQLKSKALSYFRIKSGISIISSSVDLYQQLKLESRETLSNMFSNITINEWIQDKIDENIVEAEKIKLHFKKVLKLYIKIVDERNQAKQVNEQFEITTNRVGETNDTIVTSLPLIPQPYPVPSQPQTATLPPSLTQKEQRQQKQPPMIPAEAVKDSKDDQAKDDDKKKMTTKKLDKGLNVLK